MPAAGQGAMIPLNPAAVTALNEYIQLDRDQLIARSMNRLFVNMMRSVFPARLLEALSTIRRWPDRKGDHAHTLRHSFAALLLKTAPTYRLQRCSPMRIFPPHRCIPTSSKSSSRTSTTRRIPGQHKKAWAADRFRPRPFLSEGVEKRPELW